MKNPQAINNAAKDLGFAEAKAVNLKVAILGLGTAFVGLMAYATNAGTKLFKFHEMTGLSTQSLQRWQMAGARAGVAADEIQATIEGIQSAQTELLMGQGNVAPWALLGIDSRVNPFEVLWQLHQRVKESAGMNPAVARSLAAQMGVSGNMLQFLRRDDITFGDLAAKQLASDEELKKADELNGKFLQLTQTLRNVAIRIGDVFGDRIVSLFDKFSASGGPLDKFLTWLEKLTADTEQGAKMRSEFVLIAEGVGLLTAALLGLSAAAKGVATVSAIGRLLGLGSAAAAAAGGTTAAEVGAAAVTAGGAGLGAVVAGLVAAALPGAAVVAYHEIAKPRTQAEGDTGIFGHILYGLMDDLREFRKWSEISAKQGAGTFGAQDALDLAGRRGGAAGGSVNITVHQTIHGTSDPVETGKTAVSKLNEAIKGANSDYINQVGLGGVWA